MNKNYLVVYEGPFGEGVFISDKDSFYNLSLNPFLERINKIYRVIEEKTTQEISQLFKDNSSMSLVKDLYSTFKRKSVSLNYLSPNSKEEIEKTLSHLEKEELSSGKSLLKKVLLSSKRFIEERA